MKFYQTTLFVRLIITVIMILELIKKNKYSVKRLENVLDLLIYIQCQGSTVYLLAKETNSSFIDRNCISQELFYLSGY